MKLNSKLKKFIIIQSILFYIQQVCSCNKLFKDRMKVISEVIVKPDFENDTIHDRYLVEEFIDISRNNRISSMRLYDIWGDTNKIYYTDLNQDKSVEYDERMNNCNFISPYQMRLSILRRVVIRLLSDEILIDKYIDVPMGPSVLLYGIQESLNRFRYVTTEYSETILATVDLYERTFPLQLMNPANEPNFDSKSIVMTVKILSKDNGIINKTRQHKLVDSAHEPVDILSIQLCLLENRVKMSNIWSKKIECSGEELLADIDYKFISEIIGGTLIGQDLDKSKEFQFDLNPFMQPVGIGCWDQVEGCIGDKRFEPPSLQFSAEYKTINGSRGLSYVAFDGYRKVLRLDRNNRKSVYDLQQQLSYHIGKYNLFEKEKSDLVERAQNCIVLNYDTKTIRNNIMMERLLGISPDGSACHMGSKVVDHNLYYVYETELKFGSISNKSYNLPILLEASNFLLPISWSSDRRFFVTYYVEEFLNTPDVNGYDQFSDSVKNKDFISIPKFIELWEYNSNNDNLNYERKLINRLEFTEFSWSLDVEPSGDSDSQDLSNIFNIKSCSNERSQELQLRYRLSSYTTKIESTRKFSRVLSLNPQMIREILHDNLAKKLDIPLLNIPDFNIYKSNDVNSFQIESKIVELHGGIMYTNPLGFAKYVDITTSLQNLILNVYMNRHSIDECRLDSLSESQSNTLMFCEGLSLCILFKQDGMSEYTSKLNKNSTIKNVLSQDIKESECKLEQFNWTQLIKDDVNSKIKRAQDNSRRLLASEVTFKFRYKDSDEHNSELVQFSGYTHAIDLKSLDPKGMYNSKKALVGIRYTTISEEPGSINMNMPFKLNYFDHNVFKYCQLACQLDEYCASFSICSRKSVNSIQKNDCILSTLPLEPQRIKDIEQLIRNTKTEKIYLKYKVTTYVDSQEFVFRQDPDCTIHPKDSLSSYKMSSILRVKSNITINSMKGPKDNQQTEKLGIVTTLEDCADKDYEESQWNNLARSNFTYCPLGSLCILEDDDVYKLANDHRCYLYEKTHTQFYSKKAYTRMSILLDNTTNQDSQNIDKLAKTIEGLSDEECARDCNLLKSKCLAFDSCQVNPSTTICNLYSIRSEFTRNQNKLLGYLDDEKQFYATIATEGKKRNTIKYFSTTECNHYYLNDVYFNIRLSQLLEPSESNREKANNLEKDLINEDQKRSDDIMKNGGNRDESYGNKQVKVSDSSGTLNFFLLLLGTIFGSIGLLYGAQLTKYSVDMWQYIQARRSERVMNSRISQLGLTNNLDA